MTPDPRVPCIDLNADVGEGYDDAGLIPLVSSANVACGAHAGDAATMRAAIRVARANGVAVGAHPGYPDRSTFGRTVTTRARDAIEALVAEQVLRLAGIAGEEGVALAHVKPHGALYNLSARDPAIAAAIARAVARVAPGAHLVGLAGSCSLAAARHAGLVAVAEAFVDRGYLADGTLAPRDVPGALVADVATAASRATALATTGVVTALDGGELRLAAQTLCLHGDAPDAVARARAVRRALVAAGVQISAVLQR